jgi:dihydroorotate dehydrogenase
MYRALFDLILKRMDPERAHGLAFAVIRLLPVLGIGRLVHRFTRPAETLAVEALGLRFDSPFGVAAGFDKEGLGIRGLGQLGFSHVEVGTITAIAQAGNPKPRLFRLIPDRGVINRMGFNNHGAAAAAARIAPVRRYARRPVIGINIGKSRVVDVDEATADYLASTRILAPLADYLAVNVSSPNTPGLRGLQELEKLEPLLRAVDEASPGTPVLVKIAPDLSDAEVRKIAQLAVSIGLAGIIATNTTLSREHLISAPGVVERAGAGGLSGAPLAARSLEVLRIIRAVVPADFCVISVGGVETGADVAGRLAAGATLVQGYTAFLYRGPLWARQVTRELARPRGGTTSGTRRA